MEQELPVRNTITAKVQFTSHRPLIFILLSLCAVVQETSSPSADRCLTLSGVVVNPYIHLAMNPTSL